MALPRLSRIAATARVLLAVAVLLSALTGCGGKRVYREGATIAGRPGDEFIVELASSPATGYSWALVGQADPRVVALMASDFQPAPSSGPGVGGNQRWIFRLVGPGATTISFGYGRSWENVPAEKAALFNVVVR